MQREQGVAVWVGTGKFPVPVNNEKNGKTTSSLLAQEAQEKWDTESDHGERTKSEKNSTQRRRSGMDITWLTDQIAVGGGIWNATNMAKVADAEITHIIDMQIEFDDTPLASEHGIAVLWNGTDDDFERKPEELFQRGVEFAQKALEAEGRIFIHCAAGVHRAPMMAVALLSTMGWELPDAMRLVEERRPVVDFPDVYVRSVKEFLRARQQSFTTEGR